jgi:voltage-gated potassium channel Kch
MRRSVPYFLVWLSLLALFPFLAVLLSGCASSSATMSLHAHVIPYDDVDRRQFEDAGVRVRTAHGNRVSVEVADRDTLVWFENEQTGRFTRAFLRRGNTIYVLTRESDFFRGSPSQTVAYRLFMKAWRQADQTGRTVSSSFADQQE